MLKPGYVSSNSCMDLWMRVVIRTLNVGAEQSLGLSTLALDIRPQLFFPGFTSNFTWDLWG
jgi:hypothetical protein